MHQLLAGQVKQHLDCAPHSASIRGLLDAVDETYRRLEQELQTRSSSQDAAMHHGGEMYRSMFENATDGIFQTTLDGQYLNCNAALARIYGYDSPDELRFGVSDIKRQLYVEDETRPRFIRLMQQHDCVRGFEARIFRKDGSIIWISETARAVRDLQGNFLYYEGFVSDITARKTAEEALRESEERYSLALCGANDGLWDWNQRTGRIFFSALGGNAWIEAGTARWSSGGVVQSGASR